MNIKTFNLSIKKNSLFLIILLISCTSKDNDLELTNSLHGNWYYINSISKNYEEFYFDDKYAYRYHVESLSIIKSEYEIRNGKLYFCHEYIDNKRVCDDDIYKNIYFLDSNTIYVGFFISHKKFVRFEPNVGLKSYIDKKISADSLEYFGIKRLKSMTH